MASQWQEDTDLQVSFFQDRTLSRAGAVDHPAFILHKAQARPVWEKVSVGYCNTNCVQ